MTCSIPGCGKPVAGRGWCSMHYNRWRKHGDPLTVLPRGAPWKVPPGRERAQLAADLRARYESGESTLDLEAATGWSKPTILGLLREAGTIVRPTGRAPQASAELVATMTERYRDGESMKEIADSLGRSFTFVRKTLIRNGTVPQPAGGRKRRSDALAFTDENRILWNVAHPGEPNPFTCQNAPAYDCTRLADSAHQYLCEMHARRLQATGTLERPPCERCGRELDTMSPFLCISCYKTWRYCSQPGHIGDRILLPTVMSNTTACKKCAGNAQRKRNGSKTCERCGGWANINGTHSPKRTICVSCWEGVPGCADRSGECSQPAGRLIAGRCLAHYLRKYGDGLKSGNTPGLPPSSGFAGVTRKSRGNAKQWNGKWTATICHDGRQEYIGVFGTAEEAARARAARAAELA
jgi:hypothetical protein